MRFSGAIFLLVLAHALSTADAFNLPRSGPRFVTKSTSLTTVTGTTTTTTTGSRLYVSTDLERVETEQDQQYTSTTDGNGSPYVRIPKRLRIAGRGIPSRQEKVQLLDTRTYESDLIRTWEKDAASQSGFDWEIEKLRRYFAGLRMREDGSWVKQPSLFEFLVMSSSLSSSTTTSAAAGTTPRPVGLLDVLKLFAINFLTNIGFGPALGMAAVPNAVIQKYEGSFLSFIKGVLGGDLQTLAGGPLFLLLAKYFHDYGPIFNLSFGPKSFLVISDPVMARHVLRSSPDQYCKGMLSEILEPIMGKGLIPADPVTWKVRRRAIVPGFHKKWLNRMITLFAERAEILTQDLENKVVAKQVVDMEERFCSVTLDIIGKAVFNYDFGSVTTESPVVKAVYRVLREAEHRSTSFIPYWNLPYADQWMGGQVEFRKDMTMLDDILADLINQAVSTRQEASIEELEQRDNQDDPSLLRFLVDMRGEDLSSMVLRDDLMTMLIAGHETTAAMLTWTLFELSRGPVELLREIQAEVRTVLKGKDRPNYDDIVAMRKLRFALIEALRLYPEPPLLIRRARSDDNLPPGSSDLKSGVKVLRGTDMFISTWNLHRSPDLWDQADKFDPTRWDRPFKNGAVEGWEGYNPDKISGLYPNEQASDFAFLPFGGGQRKCVGDQFAMMEAAVTLSMVLKKFDFEFAIPAEKVGMKTGATIHTMNGLMMRPSLTEDSEHLLMVASTGDGVMASPKAVGWWEKQHLKRGLNVNGRPFDDPDAKAISAEQRLESKVVAEARQRLNGASLDGGCPVQH